MIALQPFQRRFIAAARMPDIRTTALSLPRGNGKSWLAGRLAADAVKELEPGQHIAMIAGSLDQGRIAFRFCRQFLGERNYFYSDSAQLCTIRRHGRGQPVLLRVYAANGKTAMGLVNVPLIVCDEPGAWEVAGGELVHDAIQTAQGKPGSPLRALYIGTLAPARGGWWHDMIAGGDRAGVHVTALQGDAGRWRDLRHVYSVNPLSRISAEFRKVLRDERDEALADTRLRARFLSYRLNVPTADESEMLLTVEDWEQAIAREVPPAEGAPVVGIDLGASRSWSAATAIWPTGRCEAVAVAPGIPDLVEQEKRDRVPAATYRRLAEAGALLIADGLRVPPPAMLIGAATAAWGKPKAIICDRFRLAELRDCTAGIAVLPRTARWSEASEDIRALRRWAKDGPLGVPRECRKLIEASLSAAIVKNDDQGSIRLTKRGSNAQARDDVAAAMVLAAGEAARRASAPPRRRIRYAGMVT